VNIRVDKLFFSNRNFTLTVERLEFESGRLTSIVGPNGAGKTTLLKCLAAINPLSRDTVFLGRQDLAALHLAERARLISYVPQEHTPVFGYTVRDFVLTGRAAHLPLFALPSARDEAAAQEALEYIGLEPFADRPYSQLSSGERRLVLIARALAQEAQVLFLDEPTTFLDPKHEWQVLEFVSRLAGQKGLTVLITLHNLDMAVKYSNALVFLKQGRVIASGRPDDILTEKLLQDVYDLPMKIVACDGRKLIVR
jgi:iron complex transport system ATP-binding protein